MFVGVFDSGIGGLTVLKCLRRVAPSCDFCYIADQAFCPYGTKSAPQIRRRAVEVAHFLQKSGASHIIIACNTASVFADDVRRALSVPVLDVIAPTCNAVLQSKCKTVALLATNATVKSGAYQNILKAHGIQTIPFACSDFVPLVEAAAPADVCSRTVANRLEALPSCHVDAVILGCTHFPYLIDFISPFCKNAQIISCAEPVAETFRNFRLNFGNGTVRYLTTGKMSVEQNGLPFEHIDI